MSELWLVCQDLYSNSMKSPSCTWRPKPLSGLFIGWNHWKRKCFAETCLKTIVKSHKKNLFSGGFSLLKPLCYGLSCMPPLEYIVVVCSTEFAYSVGVVDGRHTMVDIVKFGLVQNILLPCGASIELTLGLKEKLVSVFQFVVFKFQILE